MESFDRNKVVNFPTDESIRPLKVRDRIYAVKYEKYGDDKKSRRLYLGVVVDNVYYPMEQYKSKFKKSGALREIPAGASPLKEHRSPRPNNLQEILKNVSNASAVPKGKYVRAKKDRGSLYIIETRYYMENGERKKLTSYLGKIIDGRYYKMDEYRAIFKRQRKSTVANTTVNKEISHG